ncbi:MAG: hypothetical protein IPP91_11360 [Betaproteobacteria bacterium]|nr:hypothetical protein [Betaproteobacteria bacterium]
MASIRLHVDPATPHGKMLVEVADHLYEAVDKIARLKAMMGAAVRTESPPLVDADFAPLQAELGMTGVTDAKTLFYLLNSVATAVDAAPVIREFMQQIDQG